MIEKRSLPRISVPIRIEYARPIMHEPKSQAKSTDISLKGLRLVTNNRLKVDDILDLFFHLPDQPFQEAVGKVVWAKENNGQVDCGVYFLNISDPVKQNLLNYIFKYFPKEMENKWWKY